MKSRTLAGLLLFACASVAHATPESVAVPTAAQFSVLEVNRIDSVVAPQLDLLSIAEEDTAMEAAGLAPRFAIPEQVSITPATHGTWENLGNGQMLWRLRVTGRDGTTSLNLGFTRFKMPKNGRLLLYSTDGTQVVRPFTSADNESHGELWTPVIPTSDLIVELTVPKREVKAVELKLGQINQGYRGFGAINPGYKSGSCNLDVECLAAGDTWRDEMRAVGVMSQGGTTFCTGSLINNTAGDRKMFFITANHCSVTSSNAASLVVYWNYQNSYCRAPGSAASGAAGDGSFGQFHSGSFFRASYSPSDVTLVELDDPPVAAYNHHWAGWDRSTGSHTCTTSAPCASIHHPSTDEKRITYVTTNMVSTSYSGTTSPGDGTHLWAKWATDPPGPYTIPGVTEPGSSGSPLYNSAGRFVGQLHGGPSSCGATGNNLSDYYGRFSVSWTGGGTNSTRLSNWLDAGNTGATTTNGINNTTTPPPCTATAEVEPNNTRTAPQAISGTCNQISGTFLNDTSTGQEDFYRLSLPAGRTVTALLNGLTVDYDVYIYNSTTGSAVASSTNGGTTADTASWTNSGSTAVNVYVRVYRYSSTRTTYQLRVSY
jgi:lysyl endopeptidase